MGVLSPRIHRLLVRLSALQNENIDDLGVGDVAVAFELCADDPPDVVRVAIESEGVYDFWGL